MNRKHRTIPTIAALSIFASLVAPSSEVARADDAPVTVQATTDAYTSAQQQMSDMQLRYGSLSSAMAGHYAGRQQQAIASYLAGGPGQFGSLSGLSASDVKALSAALPAGATAADLDVALATRGLTLSSKSFSDVSVAAAEIRTKARSLDATVAQAGMNWAQQMLRLRAPELLTPAVPEIDTTAATSMPAEGLAFGMFMNRSLNALILNYPDVFSQVAATGIGTKASQDAWGKAMGQAMNASAPDFSKMLPTKCGGAFLDALGGKSNGTEGCSPCVAAGRLANAQMGLIFDPSKGSTLPDSSSALNPAEWERLTPAQREQLVKQNPSIADALGRATTSTPTGCSAAGAAVNRNVKDVLPDVLGYLND
jgi:hypothetical protein